MKVSFKGQWKHKINAAGRISIPSKFRDVLQHKYGSDEIVIVKSKNQCLLCYPIGEWSKKEQKLVESPAKNEAEMREKRRILSSAEDLSVDRNGRILIPISSREQKNLKDECIFVGMIDYFEVWSSKEWEKYMNVEEDNSIANTYSEQFNEFNL